MVCIIMPSLNASHKFPGQQEREYLILGRPTSFFPSSAKKQAAHFDKHSSFNCYCFLILLLKKEFQIWLNFSSDISMQSVAAYDKPIFCVATWGVD
jgi:hypothetical protein